MPDTVDLLALRRRVNRKRDPVMRTFQGISRVLPRLRHFVKSLAREFDITLGPDGGRKMSAKTNSGRRIAVLKARRR